MAEENPLSLFDRISFPTIPKDVARKIDHLEKELVFAEIEQLRKQHALLSPVYAKRNALVASKELQEAGFWPRVFASAPQTVDQYVLPSDTAVIGQCLKNLTVDRFELDAQGNGGDPRNLRFTFDFATGDDNPYFTDARLVKDFYYRTKIVKTPEGKRYVWEGYVSAPVRIHWKEDQDLTRGLLDAACDLYEAEQKDKSRARTKLPEYQTLEKKLSEIEKLNNKLILGDEEEEDADDDNTALAASSPQGISFFAWFGYRGNHVTAEQSAEANKEELERWQKIEKSEAAAEEDYDGIDEDYEDEEEVSIAKVEVFPGGNDFVFAVADDLWPHALRFYADSYNDFDDDDIDIDLDDLEDDEDDDDDDDDEEEDDEDRPAKKVKS